MPHATRLSCRDGRKSTDASQGLVAIADSCAGAWLPRECRSLLASRLTSAERPCPMLAEATSKIAAKSAAGMVPAAVAARWLPME